LRVSFSGTRFSKSIPDSDASILSNKTSLFALFLPQNDSATHNDKRVIFDFIIESVYNNTKMIL
jgi:hypothetical protein